MTLLDAVTVLLLLTNLVLLGSSRLAVCIRTAAIQGVLVGALPLLVAGRVALLPVLGIAAATIAVKGVAFPMLMVRVLRDAGVRREVEPYVGYTLSLLLGLLALGLSFWISARLPLPGDLADSLIVPAAFFNIFVGLLLIMTRKKALTQVLGYLVLENGIYIVGIATSAQAPLLVELGMLLDVFVAVFIMGILIFHISREFEHMDTDQLSTLKDWEAKP